MIMANTLQQGLFNNVLHMLVLGLPHALFYH